MHQGFLEKYNALPEEDHWFANGNFGRGKDLIVGTDELIKYNIAQDLDLRDIIDNN